MKLRADPKTPVLRTPTSAAHDDLTPIDKRSSIALLLAWAVLTVGLWHLPFGNLILYPLTILATWFHEMGHGMTAVLLGGQFQQLILNPDGSGEAMYAANPYLGTFGQAIVAGAGPTGPAVVGSVLLLAGTRKATSHIALIALGMILIGSAILVVRSLFGVVATILLGIASVAFAVKANTGLQAGAVQFIAVQAFASTYLHLDYIFSDSAVIGGQLMVSDTGQMGRDLLLPYWFWGSCIVVISLALLAGSLWLVYGKRKMGSAN